MPIFRFFSAKCFLVRAVEVHVFHVLSEPMSMYHVLLYMFLKSIVFFRIQNLCCYQAGEDSLK